MAEKPKKVSPPRTFNYDKAKQFIEIDSKSGCLLLTEKSEELRANSKLLLRCKCGNEFITTFSRFTNKNKPKRQCNKCSQESKKNTYEKVKEFIENNSKCVLLNPHKPRITSKEDLLLKCECGAEFKTTFNQFKSGNKRRCNKCNHSYVLSYEEVKLYIEQESKGNCELINTSIRGWRDKFYLKCLCGNIFKSSLDSIYRHKKFRCNGCFHRYRASLARLTEFELNKLLQDNGCSLVSDYSSYVNNSSIIDIRCSCGEVFSTNVKTFSDKLKPKTKCDRCTGNISRGEQLVEEYLKSNNMIFKRQYTFSDCKNKNVLPFDFAVFNSLGDLLCLIEYDGQQHFEPIDHWGGEVGFKYRKINDRIKEVYCKERNIPLIRVPYYEKQIDDYLNNKMKEVCEYAINM